MVFLFIADASHLFNPKTFTVTFNGRPDNSTSYTRKFDHPSCAIWLFHNPIFSPFLILCIVSTFSWNKNEPKVRFAFLLLCSKYDALITWCYLWSFFYGCKPLWWVQVTFAFAQASRSLSADIFLQQMNFSNSDFLGGSMHGLGGGYYVEPPPSSRDVISILH